MKIIDVSDEVWMLVHQRYGMSWIVYTLYPVLKKKLLDLAATEYDVVNLQNNVKNEKRHAMYKQKNNDKKTIIIYPIIMNCSINM